MIEGARYVHTNLVAGDWRRLADFYQRVFGCEPVGPERDYAGADLEAGTGLPDARLTGAHLSLPGGSAATLEIFSYGSAVDGGERAVNRLGFGHVAFDVPSVADARRAVIDAGGSAVGEVVTLMPAPDRRVTWCYVRDPEGNVIELQSWEG